MQLIEEPPPTAATNNTPTPSSQLPTTTPPTAATSVEATSNATPPATSTCLTPLTEVKRKRVKRRRRKPSNSNNSSSSNNNNQVVDLKRSASPEDKVITTDRPAKKARMDKEEDRQNLLLVDHLSTMFPSMSREYLAKKAENVNEGDNGGAIDRLIGELLQGNLPENDDDPRSGPSREKNNNDDEVSAKCQNLQIIFPNADREFLYLKVVEYHGDEDGLNGWIMVGLESEGKGFPPSKNGEGGEDDQYLQDIAVQEILSYYPDPESHFSDTSREVSDLYKKHALAQLKEDFREIRARDILKAFTLHNWLYYPSLKVLRNCSTKKRKSRPDAECGWPKKVEGGTAADMDFLKELQYSRMVEVVRKEREKLARMKERRASVKKSSVRVCLCCFSDSEAVNEEFLPCRKGHFFCVECVKRASVVAIGEGKTKLICLGQCEETFELSVLQRAVDDANTFSKWLARIQLGEVKEAIPDGLESCPFCEFVAIMDTSPEEDMVFPCQGSDCGKESCRLCRESSHLPLRCEEVERDAEVQKRTYIENKMSEALIRHCWKCETPFFKVDGCNRMTCGKCGAMTCYLCRQPVPKEVGYAHFYGQGGEPGEGRVCSLWSDNVRLNETDVAREGMEAKRKMEEEVPDVLLRHDPTAGIIIQQEPMVEVQNEQQPPPPAAAAAVLGEEAGMAGQEAPPLPLPPPRPVQDVAAARPVPRPVPVIAAVPPPPRPAPIIAAAPPPPMPAAVIAAAAAEEAGVAAVAPADR